MTAETKVDEWLRGAGPDEDVVLCTRVRLARNIEGYSFSARQDNEEARTLTTEVERSLRQLARKLEWTWVSLDEEAALERQVLVERHLISRELGDGERARGALFDANGRASLMVNEEDHLRLQIFRSGFRMQEAWEAADEIDDQIAAILPYAYSTKFGFLTSCPTNTGTGMRISLLLHLPALVAAKEIEKATNAIQEMNMTARGLYGEGSQAVGDLFQISNQRTLGASEEEILRSLESAVQTLLRYERNQREGFLRNEIFVADRALGVLERAKTLTSEETLNLLSRLRLGRVLGVTDEPSMDELNLVFLLSQPGHLQKHVGQELDPAQRDVLRADLVRKILHSG